MKDGTASRPGQYDGTDDGDYIQRSQSPSPKSNSSGSPEEAVLEMRPTPSRTGSGVPSARSVSPAPMTGFVTGTSPMYPYNMHGGFPFNEAHTPTAIRG